MAFGLGLNLGFQSLKPEDDEEMKLVLSIGGEFAKKYGKPTPELKRQAQEEINGALSDYRRRKYSQSMTGPDMASNLAEPLMQHDFSAGLMQDPPEIDPSVMSNIGTAETLYGINTRRAHEKAAVPWDMGKTSTFEKVSGVAGLAAMGLGMAGVGGKRGQAMLGAVSKQGLGYALGAPQRYRQRQDRTLQSELAQTQAGRYEALGMPRAQQQQYEYDKEYSGDMFGRDETRGDFLLRSAGLKQSADELALRKTGGGRTVNPLWEDYRRATDLMESGAEFEDLPIGAKTGFLRLPGALTADQIPTGIIAGGAGPVKEPETGLPPARIAAGRRVATTRAKKAKGKVRQLIAKQNRALSDNWISGVTSTEEILDAAKTGELKVGGEWWPGGVDKVENTDLIQAILEYEQWNDPMFVQNWLDSEGGFQSEYPEVVPPEKGRETTLKTLGGNPKLKALEEDYSAGKISKAHYDQWKIYYEAGGQ